MHAVDEYAALVGALGNKAGRAVKNPRELKVAVDYLYGCRRINQRNVELLMQWRESQALAAEVGVPQEALRTIERTDEMIRTARLARQVSMLTSAILATRPGCSAALRASNSPIGYSAMTNR